MEFDNIKEILVTYNNGHNVLYKDKGVRKFFKLVDCQNKSSIDNSNFEEIIKPKKKKSNNINNVGGYKTADLSYDVTKFKGDNINQMAKQMASSSGLKFEL